jgi:sensor histidine kinase YesM
MKNKNLKILLLILIVFLLFKKVLKLYFFGLPLFMGYSITLTAILILINNYLSKKYLSRIKEYIALKSINIHIATFLITFVNFLIICFIGFGLKIFDTLIIGNETYAFFQAHGGLSAVFNFSLFFSFLIYLYYYISLSVVVKDQQIEHEKVISGNVSAQFESLKNQLDPHFLFNSLNVLNALIEENPSKAQEFTNSLSRTYRYILDQKDKELVLLEEELKFAQTYIDLLQMRFEDSLTYSLPTEIKQEGAKVVPLSLQLLLENVIKHNKATNKKPIHINIYESSDGYLIIENNLNKKNTPDNRKGIGLQNIAGRYAILTSKPIKIEENEEKFIVKIPILTKKIEHMKIIDVSQNEQELLIEAKKKVEKIKKFYAHLTSYIMVNTFLIILNLMTAPEFMWSLIVVFAWGIGLVSDAMKTYNYNLFLGKDWEDRKIREYMDKNKSENTAKQWD